MAPRTYFPWRSCDFCGRRNTPTWETRYERRGWTLHYHSSLLTCPGCAAKGREAEQRAIRAFLRADRLSAEQPATVRLSEPAQTKEGPKPRNSPYPGAHPATSSVAEPYHDAPLRRTHRIRLAGSSEEIDVSRDDGRFYALDGTWHLPVNDDRIARILKRYTQNDEAAPPVAAESGPDKRYREVELKLILHRLEDIATVLRRHQALADALPGEATVWNLAHRESQASNNLYTSMAAIRYELALRTVWISHKGLIICRIGGAMCKFLPENLPGIIADARRNYRPPMPRVAPPRPRHCNEQTPEATLTSAQHNAQQAASLGTPGMAKAFTTLLQHVRDHFDRAHCG